MVERTAPGEPLAADHGPEVGEAQGGRVLEHLPRIGQAQAQRVLERPDGQGGLETRQHRDVAEGVTRAEVVHDPAPVDHLHRTGPHHPQVVQRRPVGSHDRLAGGDVLHLEAVHETEELLGAQGVVRRLAAEEVGVLLHGIILVPGDAGTGDAAGFGERETLRYCVHALRSGGAPAR